MVISYDETRPETRITSRKCTLYKNKGAGEKGPIAQRLKPTHFIDDSDENLKSVYDDERGFYAKSYIDESKGILFHFKRSSKGKSMPRPKYWAPEQRPEHVKIIPVAKWSEISKQLSKEWQQPTHPNEDTQYHYISSLIKFLFFVGETNRVQNLPHELFQCVHIEQQDLEAWTVEQFEDRGVDIRDFLEQDTGETQSNMELIDDTIQNYFSLIRQEAITTQEEERGHMPKKPLFAIKNGRVKAPKTTIINRGNKSKKEFIKHITNRHGPQQQPEDERVAAALKTLEISKTNERVSEADENSTTEEESVTETENTKPPPQHVNSQNIEIDSGETTESASDTSQEENNTCKNKEIKEPQREKEKKEEEVEEEGEDEEEEEEDEEDEEEDEDDHEDINDKNNSGSSKKLPGPRALKALLGQIGKGIVTTTQFAHDSARTLYEQQKSISTSPQPPPTTVGPQRNATTKHRHPKPTNPTIPIPKQKITIPRNEKTNF